jgi:hypothetical protein
MTSKPRKRKRTGKRKRSPYTVGEINRLIDVLIHPLAEKDTSFILLDGILHALNERNPPQSLRKFIKYNLPEIVKRIEKTHTNELEE